MTKREILDLFAQTGDFLTPDQLRVRLHWRLDRRSAYSYLQRLAHQGLLERSPWGRVAYRLTSRGYARLRYFKEHTRLERPDQPDQPPRAGQSSFWSALRGKKST